jgi:CcmD family protein
MDTRNFLFMFYGFLAAWVIVMIYIITLARRNSRLKRELDDVKRLLDVKETRAEDRAASLPHGRGSVQG